MTLLDLNLREYVKYEMNCKKNFTKTIEYTEKGPYR